MLACLNKESLKEKIKAGKEKYCSRSRNKLWVKGETSGHWQLVRNIKVEWDSKILLILVDQVGSACHESNKICFFKN